MIILPLFFKNFLNFFKILNGLSICSNVPNETIISNFSSGKQGYEIANQLVLSGAKVTLISGPTNLEPPNNVKLIKVKSADEMLIAVNKANKNIDLAIFAAAVSDFKPKFKNFKKIKKNKIKKLDLIKNIDILSNIANKKRGRPKIVVGFAAETDGVKNAKTKLIKKNCDLIIYNQIFSLYFHNI